MAKQSVAEIMTRRVVFLPDDTTLDEAAQVMRDQGIGDVVVTQGPTLTGLVTERDIVIRAIAEGLPPGKTPLSTILNRELVGIISLSDVALLPTSMSA